MRAAVAAPLAALLLSCTTTATARVGGLDAVVELSADRLATASPVAAAKWHSGDPVEAPEREAQVLADAGRHATALGMEPTAAAAVIRDRVEANKVVQRSLHARWHADPGRSPVSAPDLSRVHTELDGLTPALVRALDDADSVLRSPGCDADLARSARDAAGARRPDRIHTSALTRALEGACS
ncbi:gamma subclass chorismate mutase AroQ [Nocardiopsis sp. NPDC058631]|uniref:gamma subclass chorismate mutase AroQ n=1 Tax=Nocardiopsis sp. NPDC058631 TaxID=3346566 RepID=UPI00365FAC24